jgi:hypothetical protein
LEKRRQGKKSEEKGRKAKASEANYVKIGAGEG